MVSSTSSRRTRLDAATTSRLLSAVTPANSNIMGLGISFDLEPSSTISTKSFNDRSTRNSRVRSNICPILKQANLITIQIKEQTPEASLKMSVSAVASHQNNRTKVSIAAASANGPPRWPGDVPGLGNTILGPRRPYISNSSCPRNITRHNSPTLSTHVTSPIISHLAPASSKSSRASRTSTKRRASSPPSTGLSAKLANICVTSPVVKYGPPNERCMAPRRCGSGRLGLSEGEKRAKAATLWQVEQEKIKQQMEMERAVSDEAQHSVKRERQHQQLDTILEGRAEVETLSPEVQKTIEYACGTTDKPIRLSVEQNDEHAGNHEDLENTKFLRQGPISERRIAKLDQAASYKQISQAPAPFHITITRFRGHTLPSATKQSTPSPTSSNDKKRVSFANQTNLTFLTNDFLNLLEPYIHLYFSCTAVRPLRLIHACLFSSSPTATGLFKAFEDTQELLKVLAEHQIAFLEKLEAMKEEFERVGMGSVVFEARDRVGKTEGDVEKIGEWMGECKA